MRRETIQNTHIESGEEFVFLTPDAGHRPGSRTRRHPGPLKKPNACRIAAPKMCRACRPPWIGLFALIFRQIIESGIIQHQDQKCRQQFKQRYFFILLFIPIVVNLTRNFIAELIFSLLRPCFLQERPSSSSCKASFYLACLLQALPRSSSSKLVLI